MRALSLNLVVMAAVLSLMGGNVVSAADDVNMLSQEERDAGFKLVFNGRDLDGWTQSGNWIVTDGAITRDKKGGSLSYQAQPVPDDFELRFQWKVGEGSNSGVYYRPGQNEYQILDNEKHADGKNPRTSAASLYFCMAPCCDATKPPGQWNIGKVICKGTVVQHWLNGKKVIGFDYADPKWAWNVDLLKKRGGDLTARGAFLSFQDHGDPVWFRAIKLRELGPQDSLDRTPVVPAAIPEATLEVERQKLQNIVERRKKQAANAGKKRKK